MLAVVPAELAGWICRQQSCSRGGCQECRQSVEAEVCRLAARLTEQVSSTCLASTDTRLQPYALRIWMCLNYHWNRLGQPQPIPFARLAQRLEEGDLGYDRASSNVLLEVVLCSAGGKRSKGRRDV